MRNLTFQREARVISNDKINGTAVWKTFLQQIADFFDETKPESRRLLQFLSWLLI